MLTNELVDPTREQIEALAASPDSGAVTMLNLLAFREGGRERYRAYMAVAGRALAEVGGCVVLMGKAAAPFIGPSDERWEALVHRSDALSRTRLIPIDVDTRLGAV